MNRDVHRGFNIKIKIYKNKSKWIKVSRNNICKYFANSDKFWTCLTAHFFCCFVFVSLLECLFRSFLDDVSKIWVVCSDRIFYWIPLAFDNNLARTFATCLSTVLIVCFIICIRVCVCIYVYLYTDCPVIFFGSFLTHCHCIVLLYLYILPSLLLSIFCGTFTTAIHFLWNIYKCCTFFVERLQLLYISFSVEHLSHVIHFLWNIYHTLYIFCGTFTMVN